MKKGIIIVLTILLLVGCNSKEKNEEKKIEYTESIMSYGEYKEIEMDKISSIDIYRYTEGGITSEEITDAKEIEVLYKNLVKLKVGAKTERACEDNTKVYKFNMNDEKSYSIEVECDWFVINNVRYEIVK